MESNLVILGTAHVYDNTATTHANDIFNGGNLYISGGNVNNSGVYIESLASVIHLTDELPLGTTIHIDASDYVTPDATEPIVIAIATNTHPILTERDLEMFVKPATGFLNWQFELSSDKTQILLVPHQIEVYSIAYLNLQGATHLNPTSYTSETPTFLLTPPSFLRCKQFLGWYDENNQQYREIQQGSVGNLTLVAHWDVVGSCKLGYVCLPQKKCNK